MKRTINRLSARQAETLKKPGRHADGGNLYLKITHDGSRRWVFMYLRDGKQREMGLGGASKGGVSLGAARTRAAEASWPTDRRAQMGNGWAKLAWSASLH
jgi:hypothetical protein